MKRVFVTGTAGFIGFHLAKRLLEEGWIVHGFDGMTEYYDVALKRARHDILKKHANFVATEAMLEDMGKLSAAAKACFAIAYCSSARCAAAAASLAAL